MSFRIETYSPANAKSWLYYFTRDKITKDTALLYVVSGRRPEF